MCEPHLVVLCRILLIWVCVHGFTESFPVETYKEMPTPEARTQFIDEMAKILSETVDSIEDYKKRIKEAEEEEERKKRKLERAASFLAHKLRRSSPEIYEPMDISDLLAPSRSPGKTTSVLYLSSGDKVMFLAIQ